MPTSAKGTTVAQANSECTLIAPHMNRKSHNSNILESVTSWLVVLQRAKPRGSTSIHEVVPHRHHTPQKPWYS